MPVSDNALQELAALAGVVLTSDDLHATLVDMCRIAIRAVPGTAGASITTFPDGVPGALASDDWARSLDELQYAEHEGPCLDAYRTGTVFRVRDFNAENRWPFYSARAREAGAVSMISSPMTAQGKVVGALNLYSRVTDGFDTEAASLAQVVAGHAGLATEISAAFFHHRDLAVQMREAMRSRAVIEQAKGVIIGARGCDPDAAFDVLREMSQSANRKLRDVALDVVAQAQPARPSR